MQSSKKLLWECDSGTRAKLEVLQRYLGAWFNILASSGIENVLYVDGFCGPGEYVGGEKGSPVVAAELANSASRKFPNFNVHLVCIDVREEVLDHLQALPAIRHRHSRVNLDVRKGEFAAEIVRVLHNGGYHTQWPIFSFVDPFGFSGISQSTFQLLMRNRSSEVFVNLWCGFMNRFIDHPDDDVRQCIANLLGKESLPRIVRATDRISEICSIFQDNLQQLGPFVRRFMMRDENNTRDNALFFCGRNERGLEKVKEAMWKVDPVFGASFSEHGSLKSEETLPGLQQAQTASLRRMLLNAFSGRPATSVASLIRWTIVETETYLPRHLRQELEYLNSHGRLTYIDPAPTGRKRQAGHWPERLQLTFMGPNG